MSVKDYIKRELDGLQNTLGESGINVDETIDIFLEVLQYSIPKDSLAGVGEKIMGCLTSLTNEDLSRTDYIRILDSLNSTEVYSRVVLFLTDPVALKAIEDDQRGYSPILKALGFNQNQIQKMAGRRNEVGPHAWELMSMGGIYSQIDSFLADYIKITAKKVEQLRPIVRGTEAEESSDFITPYIKGLISEYEEELNLGFVYMDVHWEEEKENPVDRNIDTLVSETFKKSGTNRHIKILGEAGAGKTTALKRIQYVLAGNYLNGSMPYIPVLIHLGDIVAGDSPFDAIRKKLGGDIKEVNSLMKAGEIVLLLDGYNEILDTSIMHTIAKYVDLRVSIESPNTFIVLTDRMISRNNIVIMKNASNLFLKEISLEEKMSYFSQKISEEDVIALIKDMADNNPSYFDSINTPFKMNQFIQVVSETKTIPFDLTEAYLQNLIERERNEKKEVEMRDIEDLLQALAVYLSMNESEDENAECGYLSRIQTLEVLGKVKNALGFNVDTKHFLDVVMGMNILVEENRMIEFSNPEYYDYFRNEGLFSGMSSLFE